MVTISAPSASAADLFVGHLYILKDARAALIRAEAIEGRLGVSISPRGAATTAARRGTRGIVHGKGSAADAVHRMVLDGLR